MANLGNSLTLAHHYKWNMSQRSTFTHLYSTNNPTELALVKHALTTEGINFQVKNENALNIDNIFATGIDGALVQVNFQDKERAEKLLIEKGLMYKGSGEEGFDFMKGFASVTNKIPILDLLPAPYRLVAIVFLLVAIPLILMLVYQI